MFTSVWLCFSECLAYTRQSKHMKDQRDRCNEESLSLGSLSSRRGKAHTLVHTRLTCLKTRSVTTCSVQFINEETEPRLVNGSKAPWRVGGNPPPPILSASSFPHHCSVPPSPTWLYDDSHSPFPSSTLPGRSCTFLPCLSTFP